ncbi:hypothetical protein TPA0910_14260 [Streptomyces hygroscopicus subsp. sporocinereus]|uniref:Uncharacterized protein n=1 Tax=Streptomyces hygroscopicus TaxID=1912 RepID=A0ABQ3TVL4_STRHY|nr:hypothetical protein [Streptomyces hygroscopicus]GHJ26993.1 hypothetical protein TPA0910_14260 [Streptomyces hygroscopicus]
MPYVPQDVLDRIGALEREVRLLRGRAQMRPALNQISHGRVTIGEGGSLEVLAPDGTGLFGVGAFGSGWNHPDGSPQQGVLMQREDGTTAFSVRAFPNADLGGAGTQAVSIWDRTGHQVISDDTTSGRGLGSPALPMPFQPLPAGGESITNSSFVNCWFASVQAHNPVATVQLEFGAAPGSTCEVKVQYRLANTSSWTDIATDSVSAPSSSSSAVYKTAWFTFPLHGADFEQLVFVRIQARQRSGTAGVICNCLGGYTRRTYSPDEVPDPPVPTLTAAALNTEGTGSGQGIDAPVQPPRPASPLLPAAEEESGSTLAASDKAPNTPKPPTEETTDAAPRGNTDRHSDRPVSDS